MLPWLSGCVAAAKASGLDVIDGVYNSIGDDSGLRAELEQGRTLGMDGKTLIHPSQIGPCNEVFTPPADEVEWARKILVAFEMPENAGKGVLSLEGRMVERLHADMARRTVAIADAIVEREGSA
jgi:citrate lyase subunit beta/citryl-CoA lyase